MIEVLYGRNAVREALRARRRELHRLRVSSGVQETGVIAEIIKLAGRASVPLERVERQVLDRQLRDMNHQGVALEVGAYPYVELEDCLALAAERKETALLLLLDHLQDPQNIGTLLRTAEAVGGPRCGTAGPARRRDYPRGGERLVGGHRALANRADRQPGADHR